MALNVTTEPKENRQLALSIEVEQARVDQELRKAARRMARDYRIPGFRKGKAPYSVIVQYLGLHNLYNEILDDLGQAVYKEAIEQESIEPYAQASLDDVEFEPLIFKLTVPLEPEVELGDYRSVRVDEDEVEVDEADVDARLEQYQEQYADWREVERPAEYGDTLNIDVRSVIAPEEGAEGDEETVVLDETDWEVTPDEENPMEPPGFDEALVGMKVGEEKEFDLEWPAEGRSIYAGKQAHFTVKLNSNQAYEKPELNDEFAQLVGPDFETLEDLKESIRKTLREEAERDAENAYLEKVLDAVLEQATLDYPPTVVEDQIDSMVNDFEQRLRQVGIESLESFLQQTGQSMEEYREAQRESAGRIAERNLIISELWKREGIQVTDEDIEDRVRQMVGVEEGEELDESSQNFAEMMRSGAGRQILEAQILQEKSLDRLLAIARGEEIPEPAAAVQVTDEAAEDAGQADDTAPEAAAADDAEETDADDADESPEDEAAGVGKRE